MVKGLSGGLAAAALLSVVNGAQAQATCTYTYSFSSGTTAVASQVNQDLNDIVNCAVQASGGTLTNGALSGTTTLPASSVITSAGSLGIGTTSPQSALNVYSTASYSPQAILTHVGGTNAYLMFQKARSGPATVQISDYLGALQFTGYSNGGWQSSSYVGAIVDAAPSGSTVPSALTFNTYSAEAMRISSSGYVGIGTTSPSYPLTVNGTAYATGAAGALSDRRDKADIRPYTSDALNLVARLKPVTFEWKEPKDDGMRGRQIGFIAQDVETVIPDVVLTMNDEKKTLGLKYDSLIPVLTKALQQQQAEIAELTAAVRTLQSANGNLRQKVEDIRNDGGGKNVRRAAQ